MTKQRRTDENACRTRRRYEQRCGELIASLQSVETEVEAQAAREEALLLDNEEREEQLLAERDTARAEAQAATASAAAEVRAALAQAAAATAELDAARAGLQVCATPPSPHHTPFAFCRDYPREPTSGDGSRIARSLRADDTTGVSTSWVVDVLSKLAPGVHG
jgi:hypothetical protein